MLQIVIRCCRLRFWIPGPTYSNTLPNPPFAVFRRSISRMTSLAVDHGRSAPVRLTRTTAGMSK